MSCARAGKCGAGGTYVDSSGGQQAFVVNTGKLPPPPQVASARPETAAPAASRPARRSNPRWDLLPLPLPPSLISLSFKLDSLPYRLDRKLLNHTVIGGVPVR